MPTKSLRTSRKSKVLVAKNNCVSSSINAKERIRIEPVNNFTLNKVKNALERA